LIIYDRKSRRISALAPGFSRARKIIEECYEQAVATLRANRDRLDRLAHTLLDRETLEEDGASAAAGIRRDIAPAAIGHREAS
jgi:cell division protease FtsH